LAAIQQQQRVEHASTKTTTRASLVLEFLVSSLERAWVKHPQFTVATTTANPVPTAPKTAACKTANQMYSRLVESTSVSRRIVQARERIVAR